MCLMYSTVDMAFLPPLAAPLWDSLLPFVPDVGRTVWQAPAGEGSWFGLQSVHPPTVYIYSFICVCIALAL